MVWSIPIKYAEFSNWSIWSIDEHLTGSTTLDQGESESNANEKVLNTFPIYRTGVSSSDSG